jgi:hypothetical protein
MTFLPDPYEPERCGSERWEVGGFTGCEDLRLRQAENGSGSAGTVGCTTKANGKAASAFLARDGPDRALSRAPGPGPRKILRWDPLRRV